MLPPGQIDTCKHRSNPLIENEGEVDAILYPQIVLPAATLPLLGNCSCTIITLPTDSMQATLDDSRS